VTSQAMAGQVRAAEQVTSVSASSRHRALGA